MSHTAERIEMMQLLKELQHPDEMPGHTILRALQALRQLPEVERIRDEWCSEYVALRNKISPAVERG